MAMASPKPATKTVARSDPVESFNTWLVQSISHLHSLLILLFYRYQFNALVQDPVRQLLHSLPLLSVLQMINMMACFPPARRNGTLISNSGSKSNSHQKGHRNNKGISIAGLIIVCSSAFGLLNSSVMPSRAYNDPACPSICLHIIATGYTRHHHLHDPPWRSSDDSPPSYDVSVRSFLIACHHAVDLHLWHR